jgi:2-keto-4-pentenoate hydratase/2-oxohepta-3-ene-1,7-dioic acid hydratase in catechol pathway
MAIQEYGRFRDAEGRVWQGLVDRPEGQLRVVEGTILAPHPRLGGAAMALAGLIPLPCVDAPLVVGTGLNYIDHAAEAKTVPPQSPMLFGIDPAALVGDGGDLVFPSPFDLEFGLEEPYVDPEPELVAVIGLDGQVVGYAPGNDVSERMGQSIIIERGLPWTYPNSIGGHYECGWFKSLPTFKPVGSLYRGDIDPCDVDIDMIVNGQVVQRGNTRDMIFPVETLIAETVRLLGLDQLPPGACVYTGTPGGIGYQPNQPERQRPSLAPGDRMTVRLSFGSVSTRIVAKPDRPD